MVSLSENRGQTQIGESTYPACVVLSTPVLFTPVFAAVQIPNFFLQAVLRHEPQLQTAAVALLQDDSPKSPIWQVTSAAAQCGVAPGMSSTQAKARCDRMYFRLRSRSQEEAAQEILLECAYASAAFIEATEPGVCTLDLRGLPILTQEPREAALEKWAGHLQARLSEFDLAARVGVAAAPGLALQAARTGKPFTFIANATQFWRTLPIESVSAAPEILEVLRKWGIQTVGAFLALGRDKIAARLGAEGLKVFQNAKADRIRPLNLTSPKHIYEEFFEFEQSIETLEPLLFIVRRLIDQLARRLQQGAFVASELMLRLTLESGQLERRSLKIPAATRDIEVLFRIVHNYLETVRTNSPIMGVGLRAEPARAEAEQFQLFETAVRDPNHFYETVGRLSALLGSDRVGTPVIQNSHRPDDFRMEPITTLATKAAPAGGRGEVPTVASGRGLPLRRFRPPQPATVRLREGKPIFVQSATVNASIVDSSGPWRASGQWWENLWSREEWDVQTKEGGMYRIFIEANKWYVEGALD